MARTLTPSAVAISRLSRQAQALAADIAEHFYELGRIFAHIVDGERYREAGSETFADYVRDEVGLSRATAYRAMDLYRNYSAGVARRFRISKLEAGLAYLRATPRQERPGDLIAATLRIRGQGGRFVRRKFIDASVKEIHQATALVLAENYGRTVPARLRKRVARLAQKLPEAPARLVRGDRIRMQRDEKTGDYFASFIAIPVNELDEYIAFLREFRKQVG